ncbi:MAG: hypothetical protein RIB98_13345 [Acidimicrobiales bacterium]
MAPRQIFFTHVMKTGGTSLSHSFRSVLPTESIYPAEGSDLGQVTAKTFSHLLIGLDPAKRREFRLINVHQPAWVATAVAPDALRLTVLREPIARTISHLRQIARSLGIPGDLEAVYADEGWRSRLRNYQSQLFADTQERNERHAGLGDALGDDDEAKAALQEGLGQFWSTGIARPMEIGEEEYTRAARVLDSYDGVGVTERLDDMVGLTVALTGLPLPPAPRSNVSDESSEESSELLDRIAADTEYDSRLYAHACALAARQAEPRGRIH